LEKPTRKIASKRTQRENHSAIMLASSVAKPKPKLSAAGKKRIIAASKRYWAEKRAAAKKSS
jgi:hypothetical protein